jgi:hypothetical protein
VIQLRSDCLVFKTPDGSIPCSAEAVAVELVGSHTGLLDREMLRHAAAGVLHFFREELGRDLVTVNEFAQALARVLRGFGVSVVVEEDGPAPVNESPVTAPAIAPSVRVRHTDLCRLACEAGKSFELGFFARLRHEVETGLEDSPRVLRFTGLRGCVKQLAGARRWGRRCQCLNDQIADYLRGCLTEQRLANDCALLVS